MIGQRTPEYGKVYGTTLKREDQLKGKRIGKALVSGILFSEGNPVYSVLRRFSKDSAYIPGKIECYHFREFVIDERGLVIRDAIQLDLSRSEREFADGLLKKAGL